MSEPVSANGRILKEKTFSSYNQEQSKTYANIRHDYHSNVYNAVLDYHTSNCGQLDTLLDVGCGPGLATYGLAPHFRHAIGIDPSKSMISTATSIGGTTSIGENVRFECGTAEDLGADFSPPIPDSTIDLITAANAAHWFHMPDFWISAARVLKTGGSVALWTSGHIRPHPSMPSAQAIEEVMDEIYQQYLLPYETPGNILTRDRYIDLPLPWNLDQPVIEFDRTTFCRKEWDVGESFFVGPQELHLDCFEKAMGTSSVVTRWRDEHPNDVNTDRDVVKVLRTKMASVLHNAGVEPGKELMKGDVQGVLLMVKKMG